MTTMDAKTIRDQLEVVKANLQRNEDEKNVLLDLLRGYEGWLRLYGETNGAAQVALPLAKRVMDTTTKGTISMRSAIKKVLQDARGMPLHSKEIWRRAQEMGAKTDGQSPLGLVDLSAFSLSKTEPVEKVAPRTWRWYGATENDSRPNENRAHVYQNNVAEGAPSLPRLTAAGA